MPTKLCPSPRAASAAASIVRRARGVKRSSVGAGNENRLWAACLLTPRAALISDHEWPARRQRSTK